MLKIQIKSIFGGVLFEHESEDNSIRETLQQANLSGADLSDADLSGANLSGADLSGADLRRANLRRADLSGANLSGADLSGANLSGADLSGANLPIFCRWGASLVDGKIRIGCKTKTVAEWDAFFASNEEYSTKRGAPEFKQIQAVYEAHKAYLKSLNN